MLPFSCWLVLTDLACRFGKFEAFFSTGPKTAKSVGLDIMHDLPALVVERTWIERDFTKVDALGRILGIHATDATLSRLGYPSTVVIDSRVTETRIIGKVPSSLSETSTDPDLSAAVEKWS